MKKDPLEKKDPQVASVQQVHQEQLGERGPVGPEGKKGRTGEKGDIGSSGAVGPAGPKGEKGSTGEKGPTGGIGPTGPPGTTGERGPVGPEGKKGRTGEKGDIGSSGAVGPVGPRGEKGPTGEKGTTGSSGATGPPGPAGKQGIKGDKGDSGSVVRLRDYIANIGWLLPDKTAIYFRDNYATVRYDIADPVKDHIHPAIINTYTTDTLYNQVVPPQQNSDFTWVPHQGSRKSCFTTTEGAATSYKYAMLMIQPSYKTACKIHKGDTVVIHSMYLLDHITSPDRFLFYIGNKLDHRSLHFFEPDTIRIFTHKNTTYDYKYPGDVKDLANPCKPHTVHIASIVMNFDLPGKDSALWIDGVKVASFDMTMPEGDLTEIVWFRPFEDHTLGTNWGSSFLLEMYQDNSRVLQGCVYARNKQLADKNHLPATWG